MPVELIDDDGLVVRSHPHSSKPGQATTAAPSAADADDDRTQMELPAGAHQLRRLVAERLQSLRDYAHDDERVADALGALGRLDPSAATLMARAACRVLARIGSVDRTLTRVIEALVRWLDSPYDHDLRREVTLARALLRTGTSEPELEAVVRSALASFGQNPGYVSAETGNWASVITAVWRLCKTHVLLAAVSRELSAWILSGVTDAAPMPYAPLPAPAPVQLASFSQRWSYVDVSGSYVKGHFRNGSWIQPHSRRGHRRC